MYTRFHNYHGSNIILYENNTVAYRRAGYANALTFSEKPLEPGEIFLLEIQKIEPGWTGNLRLGLTQLDPSRAQSAGLKLPQYALPDLNDMKSSWIYAISKSCKKFRKNTPIKRERFRFQALMYTESQQPYCSDLNVRILPTDVGSQIGIVYIPVAKQSETVKKKDFAELHFIVNGENKGPFARDIPFTEGPLYAVIDVYGCTKKVRILQVKVPSLQSICKEAILSKTKGSAVIKLPLPDLLKEFLLE